MRMFDESMQQPLANFQFYTYLLRVMTGKNRNKHGANLFKVL